MKQHQHHQCAAFKMIQRVSDATCVFQLGDAFFQQKCLVLYTGLKQKSRVAARVPHNQVVYHRIFPVRNTPFSDTTTAGLHLFVLFVLHFSATSRKAALTEEASSGPLFTYTGAKAETIGSLAEGAG